MKTAMKTGRKADRSAAHTPPRSGGGIKQWWQQVTQAWDGFWFSPQSPETLAIIRIATGLMLAYVHVIWMASLYDFMGETAWVDTSAIQLLHAHDWAWSWLFYSSQPAVLWTHEIIALIASLAVMCGLLTRVMLPIAWWMTLMVCHRVTGSLFGLDQVLLMLTMYLMWSACGSVWSFDRRLGQRFRNRWLFPSADPAVANNIATRLIQLHLCVIYLFGGLGKLRGEMWWDGTALWYTAVNFEYQSLDITWLGRFPIVIGALTSATIFWELFYCALVWPRLTRPLVLGMALFVHAGIALALGMITFGTIMIVANLAFVAPSAWRRP